jgi:hypothetical protein
MSGNDRTHASAPQGRPVNRSMCHVFLTERACDGHHVIARPSICAQAPSRPEGRAERGRSEAQSLARCRAQMQHRRRDGRRVNVIASVITARRPQVDIGCSALEATVSRTATGQQARVNATCLRATFSGRTGPDRPEDLGRNRACSMQQTRGACRRRTCWLRQPEATETALA